MPVVSVIIPTYNRAVYLIEAIQSTLAQTYTDFEVIVVDDGSTDGTREALTHFIANGTIRYFYQDNRGEAAARNKGIGEARGEYIAFLDSDDLFCPEHLARHVKYLALHPEVGLVHSDFSKFDQNGEDLGERDTTWFSGWIYPHILLYWSTLIAIDTVMVPCRVLEEIGGFDKSLRWATDLDMWRRIARRYPFGASREVQAKVRVHPGNVSKDRGIAAEAFLIYLNKAFADDPDLSKGFRRRALAKMYAYAAYNLLGEGKESEMALVRKQALQSITFWPFQPHAYLGFAASLLDVRWRNRLIQNWRARRFPVRN
jgi:glycosyltransferase involved in cell wall biosynthesis